MFFLCGNGFDYGIGELFPALFLMGAGLIGLYGECGIQEQHSLSGPVVQIAGFWHIYFEIFGNFFVNILQRWGKGYVFIHGEAKTIGLPGTVIGVLAEDHHFYIFKRTEFESAENIFPFRIDFAGGIFFFDELDEIFKVFFIEFLIEDFFPGWMNFYLGHAMTILRFWCIFIRYF